jgi:hypothetical protein
MNELYRELEAEEREHTDMLATTLQRIVNEKPAMVLSAEARHELDDA